MNFLYTKAYSTPLNIKIARLFQNRWRKGCHISKFLNNIKQLLIPLKPINILSRCDVNNTLNEYIINIFSHLKKNPTYENLTLKLY